MSLASTYSAFSLLGDRPELSTEDGARSADSLSIFQSVWLGKTNAYKCVMAIWCLEVKG